MGTDETARVESCFRCTVTCVLSLIAAHALMSCGHRQADLPWLAGIDLTFGSEESAQNVPPYGSGYVGTPGAFGMPPPLPVEQLRWFIAGERGLLLGDALRAMSADLLLDGHLHSISVTTHRRDGEVTYSGVSWEQALARVEFLQQTWSSNYLVAAGIADPSTPTNLEAILADESWDASEDDALELALNVLRSGQSPIGNIERVVFGETVHFSWIDLNSCARSSFEIEPLFALVPQEEGEIRSVAIMAESVDGGWCSFVVEVSETRMAVMFEDGCTEFPSVEGMCYSGGLAPTEFIAFPPQVGCDVDRPASLPMSGDRR